MSDVPRPDTREPADGRLPLPSHTTPTWEIELLLSGAVVFALFQLPDPLHAWSESLGARLGRSGDMLVRLGLVYALMANYALIAMFLTHLTSRAYWIALVGLNSVYPQGIRWDRHKQGPISRTEMQRRIRSTPEMIERADNFSSLCFAFGLLVVMSALIGAAYALPSALVAIAVSEWVFGGRHLMELLFGVLAFVIAPMVIASLIDKRLDARGIGRPQAWWAEAIAAMYRLPVNMLPAHLMLMLATNQRGRRAYVLFFGAMFALAVLMLADIAVRRGALTLDDYDYLPADGGLEADPAHYREFRRATSSPSHAPTIDAQVVTGTWMRLIVPYRPERHGPLIERRCVDGRDAAAQLAAGLASEAHAPERSPAEQSLLRCLVRELDLRVDGAPASGLDAVFSRDPGTGLRGVLVMVPMQGLAPGRHTLSLRMPPRGQDWDDAERLQEHDTRGPLSIPFWR